MGPPRARPASLLGAAAACLLLTGVLQFHSAQADLVEYNLTLGYFWSGVDSTQQLVMGINKQVPGPALVAHQGDEMVIRVDNQLAEYVTLHWHGLDMKGTPQYDGVPGLTMCPIAPGTTFTYRFPVHENPGTYIYHGHTDEHVAVRAMLGAIIVLPPKDEQDVHANLFDVDVPFAICDFFHEPEHMLNEAARGGLQGATTVSKQGWYLNSATLMSTWINGKGYTFTDTSPLTYDKVNVFTVKKGQRYRFRFITAAIMYAYKMSIEGHKMTVTASDGADTLPYPGIDTVQLHSGERYDVIITANQPIGNYWIRVSTLESFSNHTTYAVLHYEGAPEALPNTPPPTNSIDYDGVTMNCFDERRPSETCLPVTALRRHPHMNDVIAPIDVNNIVNKDVKFVFTPGPSYAEFVQGPFEDLATSKIYGIDPDFKDVNIDWSYNSTLIQYVSPAKPALVDGGANLHPHTLIITTKYKSSLQIVLYNNGLMTHPMHMHGHKFYVLGVGYTDHSECTIAICHGKQFNWETDANLLVDQAYAPLKDTVIMPAGSWVVVRVVTDNPGWWMFHCHVGEHLAHGMAFVLHELDETGVDKGIPADQLPPDWPECAPHTNWQDICYCQYNPDAVPLDNSPGSDWRCSENSLCRYTQQDVAMPLQPIATGRSGENGMGYRVAFTVVWASFIMFPAAFYYIYNTSTGNRIINNMISSTKALLTGKRIKKGAVQIIRDDKGNMVVEDSSHRGQQDGSHTGQPPTPGAQADNANLLEEGRNASGGGAAAGSSLTCSVFHTGTTRDKDALITSQGVVIDLKGRSHAWGMWKVATIKLRAVSWFTSMMHEIRERKGLFLMWDNMYTYANAGINEDLSKVVQPPELKPIPAGLKPILQGCSGLIKPTEVLAVMGPSGCGKTSLMDLLAGRITRPLARVDGRVNYGPHTVRTWSPESGNFLKRARCYVEQTDYLYPGLTPHETLVLTAQLRLPGLLNSTKAGRLATQTLMAMGLQHVAFNPISSMSGGQRRRLSLANELITQPPVAFLDEPLSGLDAAAALTMTQRICHAANSRRMAIMLSVHTPSVQLLSLLDKLLIMQKGRVVYLGSTMTFQDYFNQLGLHVPPGWNPADYYLQVINRDFEAGGKIQTQGAFNTKFLDRMKATQVEVDSSLIEDLAGKFLRSSDGQELREDMTACAKLAGVKAGQDGDDARVMIANPLAEGGGQVTVVSETPALASGKSTMRSKSFFDSLKLKSQHRIGSLNRMEAVGAGASGMGEDFELDPFNQARLLFRREIRLRFWDSINRYAFIEAVGMSLLTGLLFFNVGAKDEAQPVSETAALLFYVTSVWTFAPLYPGLMRTPGNMRLLAKEKNAGLYKLGSYVVAQFCADALLLVPWPVLYMFICFTLASIGRSAGIFVLEAITLYLVALGFQTIGIAIGTWLRDIPVSFSIGTVITHSLMIAGGFFTTMPKWLSWYRWLSVVNYGYSALFKMEFAPEQTFGCDAAYANIAYGITRCPVQSNGFINRLDMRGIPLDGGWRLDIMALVLWIIGIRIVHFVGLIFRL